MKLQTILSLLVSTVQATRVLVLLYLDPFQSATQTWNNIYAQVANHSSTQFAIVLYVDDGQGNSKAGYDSDYITGAAKLNSYPNVQLYGYVHTSYAGRTTAAVSTDIARWANWNTYTAKNIAVKGIFFDEVPNFTKKSNTDVAYMTTLQNYTRSQFNKTVGFQTFYNVGTSCEHPEYFNNMADYVCIFEDEAQLYSPSVLSSRIPAGKAGQTCVLLNEYVASGLPSANVQTYLKYFEGLGIGAANILDYGYDQANTAAAPADIGTVAQILST